LVFHFTLMVLFGILALFHGPMEVQNSRFICCLCSNEHCEVKGLLFYPPQGFLNQLLTLSFSPPRPWYFVPLGCLPYGVHTRSWLRVLRY
jgi:hypothetical protein